MISISVIIFTKNEQNNLLDCIASVRSFNQIIVLDSMSIDSTESIARKEHVEFVSFHWNKKYPKKRQWALMNLNFKNEWVLFVDADERLSPELINEIESFMSEKSDRFSAAIIPITYFFGGKELRFGHVPKKIVLMKSHAANYPEISDLDVEGMGELEGHYQPQIIGKVFKMKNRIVHNDNDPISSWALRHVRYAQWEAFLILNHDDRQIVSKAKSSLNARLHKSRFRGPLFFVYSFFLKFGFLDGQAGFDYAFGKLWYYWLSNVISRENGKVK